MSPFLLFIPYILLIPFAWRSISGALAWRFATNHSRRKPDEDDRFNGGLAAIPAAIVWPLAPLLLVLGWTVSRTAVLFAGAVEKFSPRIGAERREIKMRPIREAEAAATLAEERRRSAEYEREYRRRPGKEKDSRW